MSDLDVVHQCVGGLDVHKKTVVACRRRVFDGGRVEKQVRTFSTMTDGLLALAEWLHQWQVSIVAMESTGVLWKPVWNLLDSHFQLMLVNAHHIKQVPGRKTDVRDCEWIAQLLQYGLLNASFVPVLEIRQLRDLTRHRAKLIDEKTAVVNRIHKTLESANIKLSSVATDIMGVSGRHILKAIVSGQSDATKLADLARGTLRRKKVQLQQSLTGCLTPHHSSLLELLLQHIEFLQRQVGQLDEMIQQKMQPFARQLRLLETINGVSQRTAENILAEIGVDMSQYPSAGHLASWAGLCPGSHESAGKRKNGKTSKGNRWLRRALTEAAWAASLSKGTYLSAQYRRLATRRGSKRAAVAVAHSILVAGYYILKRGVEYQDLGGNHFEGLDQEKAKQRLVQRLKGMGYDVQIEPKTDAA
jgi:transposase